jgi:hypothetical protein
MMVGIYPIACHDFESIAIGRKQFCFSVRILLIEKLPLKTSPHIPNAGERL